MFEFLKILFKRRKKTNISFQEKFQYFRNLLKSNDLVHLYMSDLSEMLASGKPFSRGYGQNLLNKLFEKTKEISEYLSKMCGGKYSRLISKVEIIEKECEKLLSPRIYTSKNLYTNHITKENNPSELNADQAPYYYNISEVDDRYFLEVGNKMSRLGEILKKLNIPVPSGFCLTARLFSDFMLETNLRQKKDEIFDGIDFHNIEEIQSASSETVALIINQNIPPRIESAIFKAFDSTFANNLKIKLAVRSSAVGEDGPIYSFAGLHHTALNISREHLLDACWEVLISKYLPQSIVYRFINGLRDIDMPMSVGCLEMLDSEVSGVLYTQNPYNSENNIIIQAARGLGSTVVAGKVKPQEFIVEKSLEAKILQFKSGKQDYKEIIANVDGTKKEELREEENNIPCLEQNQIRQLVDYAIQIENHYGKPQDIEWAITRNKQIFILQTRDIRIDQTTHINKTNIKINSLKNKIIVENGDCASKGVASGKVFIINSLRDFKNFPKDCILVAKKNIPEFAALIHKVSAVVTDIGSTTGHLSIIARELKIPVLTNMQNATSLLKNNMEITVLADEGKIFEGRYQALLDEYNYFKPEEQNPFLQSPMYLLWENIGKFIFKLNLTDPNSNKFTSDNCLTLHDISRFAHEMSMKEMFSIYEKTSDEVGEAYRLIFEVPLNVFVIDMGNGLKPGKRKHTITKEDIISKPFCSLLKGMLTPGLMWSGPLKMDVKGFTHIMMRNMVDTHQGDREIGSRSYALISNNYLNFFSRLGYHFSRLDAFAGSETNSNYINFNFRGGAADNIRRERRAKVIRRILETMNFSVEREGDNVLANIRKIPADKLYELLSEIGRLMGAVRNTDVTMVSDDNIEIFVKAFLEGDPAPARRFIDKD